MLQSLSAHPFRLQIYFNESKTTGDVIVTGDADATYPFHLIHEYIQMLLDQHLDFLTTDRFAALKHGSMSLKHRFGNLTLAWTLRILFLVNIRDSQSGMWIFKREALDRIQALELFNNGMPFSEEINLSLNVLNLPGSTFVVTRFTTSPSKISRISNISLMSWKEILDTKEPLPGIFSTKKSYHRNITPAFF
jgi:hypothetical protein